MTKTHHSDIVLAALACAAIPGFAPTGVRSVASDDEFDVAEVVDATGETVEVHAPQTNRAATELTAETGLLRFLSEAALPFLVPEVVGTATMLGPALSTGPRQAVALRPRRGASLDIEKLPPGSGLEPTIKLDRIAAADQPTESDSDFEAPQSLARALGAALASLHQVSADIAETVGLPAYEATEYRDRLAVELAELAATGLVPQVLLDRWEQQVADDALWRFQPVLTHGDLDAELVLVDGEAVTGINGWRHAQVADPVDDLVWFSVAAPPNTAAAILDAYLTGRGDFTDPALPDRIQLGSELALARWLRHGLRTGSSDIVADATAMLDELVGELAETAPATG